MLDTVTKSDKTIKSLAKSSSNDISSNLAAMKLGKSASDLIESFLKNVEANRHLNIFITETADQAIKMAKESDIRRAQGKARPLEGIPIAVKDNFCTANIKTTAASNILNNFVPTYESAVTQKLWDAGAILIGKTNLDEFAMGSSTETSFYGPTINPVGYELGYQNLVPGGSSGGSAAAIAANMALGAIGSDTGGSVRQPASYCGVVGMKPTYGLCSRWGMIAYASSFDQAGVFGKTVADASLLLDTIMGHDHRDSTSVPRKNISLADALGRDLPKPLRIGIPKEIRDGYSTVDTDRVWQKAELLVNKLGADIVEVSMPNLKFALPAYYIIALSEASSNLSRYDGIRYGLRAEEFTNLTDMYQRTRAEGFGDEIIKRIIMGTFSLSSGYYDAFYKKAQQVRRIVTDEFTRAFNKADLMLLPTAPSGAFEQGSMNDDPVQMYLEDVFTVPINMAGLPGCSIPVCTDDRQMPLGLQIIGPRFSDDLVVSLAHQFERQIASEVP